MGFLSKILDGNNKEIKLMKKFVIKRNNSKQN